MKKLLLVALLAGVTTGVFGLDLSAGIGGNVGGFWATSYYEDYFIIFDVYKDQYVTVPLGFSAWFDANYGMAAIGFRANGNTHNTLTTDGLGGPDSTETDDDASSGFLTFMVLGRYPFSLGPVTLFPLLGIEYDQNLYWKDVDGTDLKASLTDEEKGYLNQFWFKAGAGADITLYKGLFVRPLMLLSFKVLNADERDDVQKAIDDGGANTARKTDFILEGGVQVGWRF
jgi:hypothetical protein